jgi:hypothetical protein
MSAVTISEGGCNKAEIFEFDQQTGKLTEYARLDLGCTGSVYGLEFSQDSDRVLVSYRNGGPGVEEFIIKPVDSNNSNAAPCPSCFDGVTDRVQRESCIISTKKQVGGTSGLNLGALQIASDGQIYAAVVGDNRIGQIQVGTGCTATSTFNQNAVQPMPGAANLGLPSFAQNSGSSIPEPALSLPDRLCLDPQVGAGALLEGGGEPDIDSYFWTITHEDGTVIRNAFGGPGDQFQNLEQIFTRAGRYKVKLQVDRCAEIEYDILEGEIEIVAPPTLTLKSAETICGGNPVTLTAIDGYNPADGLYDFQWTNAAGQVFGDVNSNSITVDEESIYTVRVSFRPPSNLPSGGAGLFDTCPASADVFVGPAFEFDLTQTAAEVCFEETAVTFAPNTPISGEWFYERNNDGNRVSLGEFFELELFVDNLPGPGSYEITFVTQDPILQGCVVEKKLDLLVNELPIFVPEATKPATDCATADGEFKITMNADAKEVRIPDLGLTFSNLVKGSILPVTGVLPGAYTIEAENTFGCTFSASVSIENLNPPTNYEFSISKTDETCAATGVKPGTLVFTFSSGTPQPGRYSIVRQGDGQVFTGTIPNQSSFSVDVPHGEYVVELIAPSGCRIPDTKSHAIQQKFEVVFSVPTSVTACQEFLFSPTGPTPLTYTVTNSSGALISPNSSGEYRFTQTGMYKVRGEDPTGINLNYTKYANPNQDTFVEKADVHPLLPFNGDVIYEGRWGNSIRFGSTTVTPQGTSPSQITNNWSSTGSNGDPITILRNGQPVSSSDEGWIPLTENISQDLSSVYLTSYQQIPFSIANENFISYTTPPITPAQYINPQVILNSDRVVINAKSDSVLISGQNSVGLSSNGSVNIESTSEINLSSKLVRLGGVKADQSVLKGDTTVEYLKILITELQNLSEALKVVQDWPSGAPVPNPVILTTANSALQVFKNVYNEIDSVKSKTVKTL